MITQDQLPMLAVASMNDNHLEEILLVNKLDTIARENDLDGVATVLEEYLEHSIKHFAEEEQLMQEADYPDYFTHKGEHDRHIKELHALIRYFEKNRDPKAIYVHIEGGLSPWILHHIQTMDNEAAKFIKNK